MRTWKLSCDLIYHLSWEELRTIEDDQRRQQRWWQERDLRVTQSDRQEEWSEVKWYEEMDAVCDCPSKAYL